MHYTNSITNLKKIFCHEKFYILIILALILQSSLFAQGCLPEGITFTTQEQIDNFQTNYPGCTEIEGDVEIQGSNITNLIGLSVLTSINGKLWIGLTSGTGLTSLTGLDNLSFVGGNLLIMDNTGLISLEGLNNLTTIGGDLKIKFDPIESLSGLESLTNVEGDFHIWDIEFTELDGLNNLVSIGGSLEIQGNYSLTSILGLNNIVSIGGEFYISQNVFLTNVTGFISLTTIGGELSVRENIILSDLLWLSTVNSVNGDISIIGNNAITSLTGLENINPNSIVDLYISGNELLTQCDIESICQYLATTNGYIEIEANAPGCNNQQQVEDACDDVGILDLINKNTISIYPNPTNSEVFVVSENGIKIREVNIYNQVGQIVLQEYETKSSIDISMLKKGMYVIEAITTESYIREKLIIE